MLARISRRMFFLYNVPCPGAILCYALKQKLPLPAQLSVKKTDFLLAGAERVFIRPVGHSWAEWVGDVRQSFLPRSLPGPGRFPLFLFCSEQGFTP